MTIHDHRRKIDVLDAEIVRLLNEWTRHVLEIGAIKVKAGDEIYAPHRENDVLRRIVKLNGGPIADESLRSIYREIMSSALSLEKHLTIAYLGPPATFSHQAAIRKFGSSLRYSAQKAITDVFDEVSRNRADYGVVPVENSTEGVISHTLDMLVDSELRIVSQIVLPIQHCLLSKTTLGRIRILYSHPQALAQCREWVRKNLPNAEIVESSSTVRAAEQAASTPRAAAIAGALAAERSGLRLLAADIQDNSNNATRFLVLGRQCGPPTGHDRTSLMLSLQDKVGALHRALEPMRRLKLNMTKIESRPSKKKPWEYYFFVDCDGHFQDAKVSKALAELRRHCNFVKVLGSYPAVD